MQIHFVSVYLHLFQDVIIQRIYKYKSLFMFMLSVYVRLQTFPIYDVWSIRYISCVGRREECFSLQQNSLLIFVFIVSERNKWEIDHVAFKCTCWASLWVELRVEGDEKYIRSSFFCCFFV